MELAAVMGWSRSTAAAMGVRYGHLFEARDEHLTAALDDLYRRARAEMKCRRGQPETVQRNLSRKSSRPWQTQMGPE